MPVCEGCGSSYNDEFKFCPHCARSNPTPTPLPVKISVEVTDETTWETCEIVFSVLKSGKFRFLHAYSSTLSTLYYWAKALGPGGVYSAAESDPFEGEQNNTIPYEDDYYADKNKDYIKRCVAAKKAKDDLIIKLAKDGWVMTNNDRYRPLFRRQIKKAS